MRTFLRIRTVAVKRNLARGGMLDCGDGLFRHVFCGGHAEKHYPEKINDVSSF